MTLIDGSTPEGNHLKLGWLLAGKLAEWLGMEVGVNETEGALTLVIELPSGQVCCDVTDCGEGNWKSFDYDRMLGREIQEEIKSVEDCLYGYLVNKHILVILEKKEETE